MKRNWMKRLSGMVLALALALALVPALSLNAFAADTTMMNGAQVTWEDKGTDEKVLIVEAKHVYSATQNGVDGLTISGSGTKATKGLTAQSTGGFKITFTNPLSTPGKLFFTYKVTSKGETFKLNGTTVAASDITLNNAVKMEVSLAAGKTYTIEAYTPKGSGTVTMVLSGISLVEDKTVTMTFEPAAGGSYTVAVVNGQTSVPAKKVDAATSYTLNSSAEYTLKATAAAGKEFVGWKNVTTGKFVAFSATWVTRFGEDATVVPVFDEKGVGYYEVNDDGIWYTNLKEAIEAAQVYVNKGGSAKIALVHSGVLPAGTYTIPNKVTLLIPCDDARTMQGAGAVPVYASLTNPSPYVTLEMASGANIKVEKGGAIEVASRVTASGQNGSSNNGTPRGPHGLIKMVNGSTINLVSGANLYAWGFITGDGTVTAQSGATVYECFQVKSWRGGSATVGMAKADTLSSGVKGMLNMGKVAYDEGNHGVFPFSQYYVQNVEAKMVINSGATEKVLLVANADSQAHYTLTTLIGTGSDALFQLGSGSTLTKWLNGQDQLMIDVVGNCTVNGIQLSFTMAKQNIGLDSKNYVFPLNDMAISVTAGTLTFASDIAVIPGTSISIADGATVQVAAGKNCYIYDYEESWKGLKYGNGGGTDYSPVGYTAANGTTSKRQPLADAMIDVNGTLNINGNVYTTTGGANITSSNGTGRVVVSKAGTETVTYQATQSGTTITFVEIPITSAQLKNDDGSYSYVQTAGAAANTTYTYAHGMWHVGECKPVETEAKAATCTEDGNEAYWVCSAVEGVYFKNAQCTEKFEQKEIDGETKEGWFLPALGHDLKNIGAKDPTCLDAGNKEHWICQREACGKLFSDAEGTQETTAEDMAIPATGHNFTGDYVQNENGTHSRKCVNDNCTAVSEAENCSAEMTQTTAPTCTKAGEKTGTCVCGRHMSETVEATGHNTDGTIEHKDATCTENGVEGGTYCTRCNDGKAAAEAVITKLGHNAEGSVAHKDATCTETGVVGGTYCTRCNDGKAAAEAVITKLGHNADGKVEHKDANCTETGVVGGTYCTRCNDGKAAAEAVITKLGHNADGKVEHKDASCTEDGVVGGTYCTRCDDGKTAAEAVISATGHHEVVDAAKAPTCTATGLTEGKHCSVCGTVIVAQNEVEALGHDWDEGEITTEPTCVAEGVKTYTCQRTGCGETKAETVEVLGHDIETHDAKAAACTAIGWDAYETCSRCNYSTYKEIPALGHDTVNHAAQAPTCTVIGWNAYETCARCDYTTYEEIEALGHKEETIPGKNATCTETGLTEGTKCSVCGEVLKAQDVIPANGHTEETVPGKDATCTETGLTDGIKCSVCGEVLTAQETIPAKGHTPGEAVRENENDATCTEEGSYDEVVYCTVCGEELSRESKTVAKKPHTEETIPGKAATCTETGLTDGTKCSVCGEVLVEQEVIEKIDHTAGTAVQENVKDSTCTEEGSYDEVVYCTVCGEKLSRESKTIAKKAHTEETVPGKDATCTETGLTDGIKCSVCGEVLTAQETIPAKGHTSGEAVRENENDSTCTEEGSYDEVVYCSECGEELSRESKTIAKKAHTDGEAQQEDVVAAQCEATGSYNLVVRCTVCNEVLSSEAKTIPAKGHDMQEVAGTAVAATCTAEGKEADKECSRCDHTEIGKTIDKKAHTPGEAKNENVTNATCTVAGSYDVVVRCAACNEVLSVEHVNGEKLAHSYQAAVTEPTCTAGGYTTYTCSACGDRYVDGEVSALGHDTVEHNGQAATCTGDGYEAYVTCTRCDYTTYQITYKLGHDIVTDAAVAPTCTETGLTEGSHCSRCNDATVAQQVVPATGHDWIENGEPTTNDTCGLIQNYTCSACGNSKIEALEGSQHTPVTVEGTPATCTTTGTTAGIKCSKCGAWVEAPEEIPAIGHTEVIDEAVAATCTETGLTEGKHCSVCGAVLVAQETVSAAGHTVVIDPREEATYDAPGKTEGSHCSVCGEVLTAQEAIPQLTRPVPPAPVTPAPAESDPVEPDPGEEEDIHDEQTPLGDTPTELGGGLLQLPVTGEGNVAIREDGSIVTKSLVEGQMAYLLLDTSTSVRIINNAKRFIDVKADDWFAAAVDFVSSHELFNGVSDNEFAPELTMDRAMMVTVLWRLEGCPQVEENITFADVAEGEWYTQAVCWAAQMGIVKGYDDGNFGTYDKVTREQIAVILHRYMNVMGMDIDAETELSSYNDNAEVSDWAEDAMTWAVSRGIITGVTETLLAPQADAARCQVAIMLQRLVADMVK